MNLLFILCIMVRLGLAYFAYVLYQKKERYPLSILFLAIGSGFIYLFITDQRKKGAWNQTIWWKPYRPIHGMLYLIAGVLLYHKYKYAYTFIILDTLIGVYNYMNHYKLFQNK